MKIIEMTATFGKLNRARLTLEDGLNVIHAPNEAGKSTWCAFLRAMFYGIPTRERDRKGVLAEKNRWQPWSGAPMEGQMRLIWQDKDITLRRFSRGSVPFGGFSAVYTATQEPVPGLTGDNCGQTLLGVGREVWERSAFVGHTPTLAIDAVPELERRIAALVTSGEEEVSFSQTEQLLREWQRRRRHNRTGLIPKLEEELARTDRTLEQMQAAGLRLTQIEEQRPALKQQKEDLEGEAHIHQRLAQRELNRRYAQAMEDQRQARAQLDALQDQRSQFGNLPHRDRLRDAQTQLQRLELQEEDLLRQSRTLPPEPTAPSNDPRFSGLNGTQAIQQAQQERAQAEALLAQAHEKEQRKRGWPLAGLALFAGPVLSGLAGDQLLVGLVVGVMLASLLALTLLLRSRAATRCRTQAKTILDRWNAAQPQQITEAAEQYRRKAEDFAREQENRSNCVAQLKARRDALVRSSADLLAFVRTFAPETSSLSDCSAALSGALELEDRLRECRTRLELTARRCDDLKSQGGQEADTLELLHRPQHTPEQTQQELVRLEAALAELDRQEAMARGELLALGDRAQMEARAQELEHQLRRRQQEYEALELALDCLRQANARLQERFAPELNHRAGQLLQQLTGGRYRELALNRAMEASARNREELLPRSTLSLSRGTTDQVYLAVRLAVCQLCLGQEDPSPLVLDDALLTFDEERLALALDCLAQFGRQVVLFSCQERELRLGKGHIQTLQS